MIKKYNEFVDNDIYINVDVKKLMERVEHECGNKSNLDDIVENESYKEVVENGYDSIPLIIDKIKKNECHMIWFRALNEITHENVNIPKYDNINNYWKKWALDNGY